MPEHPLVLGHEGAGVVEDGPRRGERVAIDPAIPCGTCRSCLDGYRNLCTAIVFAGHGGQDGLMREFITWPSARLHRLPDQLSDAEGAVLEPLGVTIHALDLGHLRIGGTAAVIGCGPIGLLVQLLRSAGAVPVLAGIPGDDQTRFRASVARRKGLTIAMVRRMNEVYPRAINLTVRGQVDLASLVTHQFPLAAAAEAFQLATKRQGLKVIIEPGGSA